MNNNIFERTESIPWLEKNTILLAPTGSYAYGTNVETSDRDYKGICIPPINYFLGLDTFNSYNSSTGNNFRNTSLDVDVEIFHIAKFVHNAFSGVPNNIEMLFADADKFIKMTPIGQELVDNRHLFLSKNIRSKFYGYTKGQLHKIIKQREKEGVRNSGVGYDTKTGLHVIRMLIEVIDIFTDGDFNPYSKQRDFLLSIRNGEYSFEEFYALFEKYSRDMDRAYEDTKLPEHPDYEKINELLIRLNKQALGLS